MKDARLDSRIDKSPNARQGKEAEKLSVVEVIPILKGLGRSSLSYFTTAEITPGSLVKVPVRNSLAPAIVVSSKDATQSKSDIKSSSFVLRKIPKKDVLKARLPRAFMRAAERTAQYYATRSGEILAQILPKFLLEDPELFFPQSEKSPSGEISKEPLLLQLETEERFAQYKALVRQAFARKTSVMFVVPTREDAERAYEFLSKGIQEFAYLFTLGKSKKTLVNEWLRASESPHPILFVTTPSGIVFDRQDLETIVLERENSRAYRTINHPYISFRKFLEHLAKESRKQLVLGDSVLSVETLLHERRGEYSELSPIKWRLDARAITTLVDMKSIKKKNEDEKPAFEIFSNELKSLINIALEEKKGIFLFGARKGLYPTTLCGDCGSVLSCKACGAPVVLHEASFICHACGTKRELEARCDWCTSWKLEPIGIGVDRIRQEVRKNFPKAKVYLLDKDHAPTEKEAKKVIEQFRETGGVLVGTELALLYLEKTSYAAAVSLDSLFSIPDIGIEERVFYLISHLREMAQKECIIQTRNIGRQVLAWAANGNILDFYKAEIEEREDLSYPPFSVFIKVSSPKARELRDQFRTWKPDFIKDSMIIRVLSEIWPNSELLRELSLLGPDFSIKVDPESLL